MYIESDTPINVGGGNNGCSNGMWGDNGAWWIIIFLIFALGGWNNNGWGNASNGGGAAGNYVLASDFATIQRQLSDGFGDLTSQTRYIQNGLCDGFYNMNTSLLTGFSGVNQAIMTNGYETRNAITGLSSQLANCCCTTERAIDSVNYNLANQFAQTNYNMAKNTCDIIRSSQDNTQRILDYLVNDKMTALQAENTALRGQISQGEQTATILNAVNRTPTPAYVVPNPYCCYQYQYGNTGTCSGSIL